MGPGGVLVEACGSGEREEERERGRQTQTRRETRSERISARWRGDSCCS
jgi:hypothetical protein